MIEKWIARWYKFRYRFNRFRKNLAIPAGTRVLDVGSGHSPFAPADVICEKFPWDDTERMAGFFQDRPLVVGDVEALPFGDQTFDYIYCCHVLEHTFHPERAIEELMRVGKRGYIEMPTSYYEKAVRSIGSHLWFVTLSDGQLIFTPKTQGIIDSEINDVFDHQLLEKDPLYSAFYYARLNGFLHMEIYWEGRINYVVRGTVREEDFRSAQAFDKASTLGSSDRQRPQVGRSFPYLIKKLVHYRSSKKNFNLDAALACPSCKGALLHTAAQYQCVACGVSYPIQQGVPILLKESAVPIPIP